MKTPKKPTPEQEAIAFLRSVLKLVERRGLRQVDEQFGFAMMAMANAILTPDDTLQRSRHSSAINSVVGFIEEFSMPHSPGVPISVLRAAVMVIEEALQEPDEPITAPQEARPRSETRNSEAKR